MSNTLSKIEKRTAYALTLPAVLIVFAIVLFPIFSNVWISFKEVQLKDIRIPEPRAKKIVKSVKNEDSKIKIIYKLRNSSLIQDIRNVKFQDKFPNNVQPVDLDERCKFISNKVQCDFGDWSKKYREQLVIFFETKNGEKIDKKKFKLNKPNLKGKADNILLTKIGRAHV